MILKKFILIIFTIFITACSNTSKEATHQEKAFAKIDCFEYINYSFLKKIAPIPLSEDMTSKEKIDKLIQLQNEIKNQIKVHSYEKNLYTEVQLKENLNLISDIINVEIIDILLTKYSETFDKEILALAFNGNLCIIDEEIRELNKKYIFYVMEIIEKAKNKKQVPENLNNEYYDTYNILNKLILKKIEEYYIR